MRGLVISIDDGVRDFEPNLRIPDTNALAKNHRLYLFLGEKTRDGFLLFCLLHRRWRWLVMPFSFIIATHALRRVDNAFGC